MNVPQVFDQAGVEGEILWHLADIEKRMLKKGRLPQEYVGVSLPEIKVNWRQTSKARGRTRWKRI
jgi:hypothetical protein